MPRAVAIRRAGEAAPAPIGHISLQHSERRLRRKLLTVPGGEDVLVDLPATVTLAHGDRLVLDDGRALEIAAADEDLYAVRGRSEAHLAEVAWHIGNRHLPCQIAWAAEGGPRLLIARDRVIGDMLKGLGASLSEVRAPFSPLGGAYEHSHGSVAAM